MILINLRDFRKSHNLKQSDVAEILGVGQSAISRMEMRPVQLTSIQCRALYERFGQEEVDLYKVDGSHSNVVPEPSVVQTPEQTAMAVISRQSEVILSITQKYEQLTERILKVLEKMAENYSNPRQ